MGYRTVTEHEYKQNRREIHELTVRQRQQGEEIQRLVESILHLSRAVIELSHAVHRHNTPVVDSLTVEVAVEPT